MNQPKRERLTPLTTWHRMAAKARQEHLQAYRLNGDPRFWAVSSASEQGTAYEVTVLADQLLCSCRASEFLPYCKHRAAVLAELGALNDNASPLAA